jgi:hypothetical protein
VSESYAPTPARRSHRGFREVQARAGAGGTQPEATHRTVVDVTLHYGEHGPRTLPAGTLVVVLDQDAGIARFTYDGCTAEYATAGIERFEEIEGCPSNGVAFPA